VDITADEETFEWISYYKENNGDMSKLTISTDGNGSLPVFNEEGELLGLGVASTRTMFEQLIKTIKAGELTVEEALRLVTANTAEALKLENKGVIAEDRDADLLVLSKDTYEIEHVIAKGQHMIENGEVLVKGTFE